MPFVKLDCGILDSTLWMDKDAREMFITALLMAVPCSYDDPVPEVEITNTDHTGWQVPPGDYGFVSAAGVAICYRAGMEQDAGIAALIRLAAPEAESRTTAFDGRRMVRVDGGFLVLNFKKYRDKDHTAAARARRYREKKRHGVITTRHGVTGRDVTEAEAEAEAEAKKKRVRASRFPPIDFKPSKEMIEWAITEGLFAAEIGRQTAMFRDYERAKPVKDWRRAWKNWIRKAVEYKAERSGSLPAESTDDVADRLGIARMADEPDARFQARVSDALVTEQYGKPD